MKYLRIIIIFIVLVSTKSARTQWINDPYINTPICIENYDQHSNKLVVSDDNGAFIVWIDNRNGNQDIYAQKIDADGYLQWVTEGIPVCTDFAIQNSLIAVNNLQGNLIICWLDYRNTEPQIYGQKIDPSGTMLWNNNGVQIVNSIQCQNNISFAISPDGSGGAFVVWTDCRTYPDVSDLYAQRISLAGAIMWQPDGKVFCNESSSQLNPVLTYDNNNGVVGVWNDARNWPIGNIWDIYAQRMDNTGTLLWNPVGLPVCFMEKDQCHQKIVSDDANFLYVVWGDSRIGDSQRDIYAQKLDLSGNALWTENGTAVCTANKGQDNPLIIPDYNGGAIITWTDYREDPAYWVYTQRTNTAGITQWTNNGIRLCDQNSNPHTIVCDGNGGAVIVWTDSRVGNQNIFAQRVSPDGTINWQTNGVAITLANNYQGNVTAIPGEDGETIICWDDKRNGNDDIYAGCVCPEGQLCLSLPPAPELISPINGEVINTLTPTLEWDDVAGVSHYHLQVSNVNNFTNTVIDEDNLSNSSYSIPEGTLAANTQYYWRVNATNDEGTGPWSEVWNFIVFPESPSSFDLIYPQNGEQKVVKTPVLKWHHADNPNYYRVLLAGDANFSNIIIDENNIIDTVYTDTLELQLDKTYWWKVCAINQWGETWCNIIFSFTTRQYDEAWYSMPGFSNMAREGAISFSIDGKGYITTGRYCDGGTIYYNDLWEYDTSFNTWTQKTSLPGPGRGYAVGFSIDNKGYVVSGQTSDGYLDDCWEYDPINDSWTQKANFPGNPRSHATGFTINGKGYIGTGADNTTTYNDFYEFDPNTNTWATITAFPSFRLGANGLSVNNKGYVGFGTDGTNVFKDLYRYDPVTNTWIEKTSLPDPGDPRYIAASFSIDNSGFIGTGFDGSQDLIDVWEYIADPGNFWAKIDAEYPGGDRRAAVGFSVGSYGYIGLGYKQDILGYADDFYKCDIDLPTNIWDDQHPNNDSFIKIFPNPNNGNFNITLNTSEEIILNIFDITGRCVLEQSISTCSNTIISNLPNGVYLCKLFSKDDSLYTGKIIIIND